MHDRPIHRLHRTALALSLAVTLPIAAAALVARDPLPVLPFGVAVTASLASCALRQPTGAAKFLSCTWPMFLWPLLYDGAVRVVQNFPDRYIDPWLLRADRALFGSATPDTWPLGGPVEELANLVYVSYYVVIPACALWTWLRRGDEATVRYGLAIVSAFTVCALFWLVAPSGGYHPDGSPDGSAFGPATAIMRWIYDNNPHYAAAFPSSHVSLAFAAAATLSGLGGPRLLWLWAAGIAWSTVQGQYHYAVDSPPAVLIGVGAARWALRTRGLAARPIPSSLRGLLPLWSSPSR